MNIKNIWTPNKLLTGVAGAVLSLAVLMSAFWWAGYRFNLTPSLPEGIYRLSQGPAQSGDLVTFCLASENVFCTLAKERGYLGPGSCPNGLRPLLKHLAGLPGDRLEISPDGLVLNGRLLSGTVRPAHDRQSRALPPSLLKAGVIPEGQALVLSQEHSGSFDSRHFGLVPLSSLKKVRPILTFNRDNSMSRKGFITMTMQQDNNLTAADTVKHMGAIFASANEQKTVGQKIPAKSNSPDKGTTDDSVMERMLFKLTNSNETDDCYAYLLNHDVPNYDLTADGYGNLLGVGINLEASFTGLSYLPKLQTILTIPREGKATLERGTQVLGSALMIGHKEWRKAAKAPQGEHTIYITKDYATGAAIHQGTGHPVAVAFKGTNFKTVGKILKNKFPKARITYFVKSDLRVATLLQEAWEAAQTINALVIVDDIDQYKARSGDLVPSILLLDDRPFRQREEKKKKSPAAAITSPDLNDLGDEDLDIQDEE